MNKQELENMHCTQCGRHCPLNAVSCPRGERYAAQVLSGEFDTEETMKNTPHDYESHRDGKGHGHRPEGESFREEGPWHGPHRDGRGHGRKPGDGPFHKEEPWDRPHDDRYPGDGPFGGRHPHGRHLEGDRPHRRHFREEEIAQLTEENQDDLSVLLRMSSDRFNRRGGRQNGQGKILHILSHENEMPQKHLQEILRIQPGSLSEILAKMEENGTIERYKDSEDKRMTWVGITDLGREQVGKMHRQDVSDEINKFLTEEEQETLKKLLRKLLSEKI